MVLEHQGLPTFSNAGLQPALQLYAAAAAHLAPRNRVPPWAPFLQFGVPGVFGSPFLTRPRFGPAAPGSGASGGPTGMTGGGGGGPDSAAGIVSLVGGGGVGGGGGGGGLGVGGGIMNVHSMLSNNRVMPGPASEDSNEDRGKNHKYQCKLSAEYGIYNGCAVDIENLRVFCDIFLIFFFN